MPQFESQVRTVEELAEVLRETSAGCSLLIGAGCSTSAGIPLASEFVDIIKHRYQRAYARAAAPKGYPQCMAQLDHGLRRDLIAGYVDKASLNWAHIGIARLVQNGNVKRILTTNFDPLVVRSCGLLGEFPAVYDLAVSDQFKPANIPEKAVLYLHGQHTGFVLLNTEEETKRHAARLTPIFDDAMRRRVWIVVGYSGASDPIVEDLLAKVPRFDYGLYWVTYKDSMPQASVQDKLLGDPEKNVYLIKGEDADSFFIKLTQAMGLFPPAIVDKPFSALANQLRLLPPYPVSGGGEHDVTGIQLQRIEQAIQRYEKKTVPEEASRGSEQLSREVLDSITVVAQRLLMAGDHEGVLKLRWAWEKSGDKALADVLIDAVVSGIDSLVERAKGSSLKEASRLFAEADKLYRLGRKINGQRSGLLVARANALMEKARRSGALERKELLEQAVALFEAAHLKPTQWNWNQWCLAIYRLAELAEPDTADSLYALAADKFRRGANGDSVGLYNSAVAILRRAFMKDGAKSEQLLRKAISLLRSPQVLKSGDQASLASLALALVVWARFAEADEATARLDEAKGYLQAAEAAPIDAGAYNLACAHALLGNSEQCQVWLEKSLGFWITRERLLGDPNLDSVRSFDWFQALVAQLSADDQDTSKSSQTTTPTSFVAASRIEER